MGQSLLSEHYNFLVFITICTGNFNYDFNIDDHNNNNNRKIITICKHIVLFTVCVTKSIKYSACQHPFLMNKKCIDRKIIFKIKNSELVHFGQPLIVETF